MWRRMTRIKWVGKVSNEELLHFSATLLETIVKRIRLDKTHYYTRSYTNNCPLGAVNNTI